jgi:mannitol/fructose-specific phosphotransferase system IIA component (Ntr-type)
MPIALSDLLNERQVALRLNARAQSDALRELVQLLAANGKINDAEKFLEELSAREQARPSVVDHGVAFPHLRTDLVDEIVLGIGRSKAGVQFTGGETANLIFLIGVPQRMASEYLICVGALARLLQDEAVRTALMRARTTSELIGVLNKV